MNYLFPPHPIPSLPIEGDERRFPVARIFCVGRNYEDHAKEMGHVVDREKPFYFMKSRDRAGAERRDDRLMRRARSNFHFEAELVVAIGAPRLQDRQGGGAERGLRLRLSATIMTRRDLQLSERAKQRPWDLGKDIEDGAPTGTIVPAAKIGHPTQSGDHLEAEWRTEAELRHRRSRLVGAGTHRASLRLLSSEGRRLVFTGTPAGVGPVKPAICWNAKSPASASSRPGSARPNEQAARRHRGDERHVDGRHRRRADRERRRSAASRPARAPAYPYPPSVAARTARGRRRSGPRGGPARRARARRHRRACRRRRRVS